MTKERAEPRWRHAGMAWSRPSSPTLLAVLAGGAIALANPLAAPQASGYRETLAGTTVTFEMVPVPGGRVAIGGGRDVAPLYVGRTEVTWDLYDVFALGLDAAAPSSAAGAGAGADAVARPSNPYGAPDYGWGHAGSPVISVTRAAAESRAVTSPGEPTLAAARPARGRVSVPVLGPPRSSGR